MLRLKQSVLAIVALAGFVLLQVVVLAQGTLSEQVLQLLTRDNTWSGTNVFQDLRVPLGAIPAVTTVRIYADLAGNLYYNGGLIAGAGGGVVPHNLLSTTHPDTLAASPPTRGDLIVANATPVWARFAKGASGTFLVMGALDPAWSTSGATLTALNATQLTTGTIPLARIVGITNTQIDAAAAIGWSKLDKSGSSLADLTTRSATDLSSGTLADARLSSLVSLFGTSVDTSEITNGAVTAVKLADFGCTSGQAMTWTLSWGCATFGTGNGTVTSVALSLPAIFTVTGSPITSSGTLSATLATQTANTIWAGPTTAGPTAPTFRAMVNADLPLSGVAAGTYAKVTLNTRGVATAASTQITLTTDVTGTLPLANGGTGLTTAVDDSTLVSSGTAWVATVLPSCTGGALAYNATTNVFTCVTSPTFVAITTTGAATIGTTLGVTGLSSLTTLKVGASGNTITGVFTGTTTYDPGAVADQASVTTTLTVTGAAVGQTCEAALSTIDSENLLVSAFPSAGNTVRVVIGNLSGGPLSPGSGTLRATCTAM